MLAEAFIAVPARGKEVVPPVGKPPIAWMASEVGNATLWPIVLDLASAHCTDLALAIGTVSSGQLA
jgi:hypothetical protein